MLLPISSSSCTVSHRRSDSCYASHARTGHARLKPACCSSSSGDIVCRQFTQEDLASVKRLHRFAKYEGKPVFGSNLAGVEEMLGFAAAGRSGVLGIVACSTADPSDLMGCVSAQLESVEGPGSSSAGRADAGLASSTIRQASRAGQSGRLKLVLLSLVVRADQRSRGVGAALIQELRRKARDELLAGSIETDVAEGNRPAVQFFEAAGFRRTSTDADLGGMLELRLDVL